MDTLFKHDGKLMEILDKIANIVILNFLCILGCIPIITAGASLTATYYVAMKLVKNEEGYIVRDYIKTFKREFKNSTVVWLIMLLIIAILASDFYIATTIDNDMISGVLKFIFTIMSIIVTFIMTYVFAIVAKFDNNVKNYIVNSAIISVQNLPYTALMVLINIIPISVMLIFANSFGSVVFFYVVFGCGMNVCINSLILNKVISKYIKEN